MKKERIACVMLIRHGKIPPFPESWLFFHDSFASHTPQGGRRRKSA